MSRKPYNKMNWILTVMLFAVSSSLFSQTHLQEIRYGLHTDFCRLVFDLSGSTRYQITDQSMEQNLQLKLLDCNTTVYDEGYIQFEKDDILNDIHLKKNGNNSLLITVGIIPEYRYRIYELQSPYRLVVDMFPSYLNTNTKRAMKYYIRGMNLKKNRQYDNAITEFIRAVEIDNNFSLAYFQLGQLYQEENEIVLAIENYHKVQPESAVWQIAQAKMQHLQAMASDTSKGQAKVFQSQTEQPLMDFKKDTVNLFKSIADKGNSGEMISPAPNYHSLIKLIIFAFVINCVIFVGCVVVYRKFKHKSSDKPYRTVRTSTKMNPVMDKSGQDFLRDVKKRVKEVALPKEVQRNTEQPFNISERPVNRVVQAYQNTRAQKSPAYINQTRRTGRIVDRVEQMLQYNYDLKTIAKEVALGQDEVKMIINLNKKDKVSELKNKRKPSNRFEFV